MSTIKVKSGYLIISDPAYLSNFFKYTNKLTTVIDNLLPGIYNINKILDDDKVIKSMTVLHTYYDIKDIKEFKIEHISTIGMDSGELSFLDLSSFIKLKELEDYDEITEFINDNNGISISEWGGDVDLSVKKIFKGKKCIGFELIQV